jgi:PAS domain S-box-containing protein
MSRFVNLGITAKFNILLTICMVGLFVFGALYGYQRQQKLIIKGEVDNARIIARQIIEAREYMSEILTDEPSRNYNLVPQVVATRIAQRLTKNTTYYVRQVSLRFRNPANSPDSFEQGQLKGFADGATKESYQIIYGPKGEELRYMLPMKAEKTCLECHGSFEAAPVFVQQRFPKGHPSYNYHPGEIIGAISVTIPLAGLYREMSINLRHDLIIRGGMFLLVLLAMGYIIHQVVINPVSLVAKSINRVARTGNFSDRIAERGHDEVGQLITAFNEMMAELERKTVQSRESEDRFRNFIRMARSAVVTFMEDGKIVISNDKAERLFGKSRQEIIGEDFYRFIEGGVRLREKISARLAAGSEGMIVETRDFRILSASGGWRPFEIALSASKTEGKTMLTAILRDLSEQESRRI